MGFVFIGYVIRTERRHRREDAEDRARGVEPAAAGSHPCAARTIATCEDEDSILDARRTADRGARRDHASEIRSW